MKKIFIFYHEDLLIIPSSTVAATTVPRLLRHAGGVPPFPIAGKSTPRRLLRNRGKVGGVIELRQHNDCSSAQGEVCIIFKRNEAEWLIFYFNTFVFHSLSYKRLFLALRRLFRSLTEAAREKINRPLLHNLQLVIYRMQKLSTV